MNEFNAEEAGEQVYDLFKNHSLSELQYAIKNMPRKRLFFPFPYVTLVMLILEIILWLYGRVAQQETIAQLKLRDIKEIAERFPKGDA